MRGVRNQPQRRIRLNREHPLAQGLMVARVGSQFQTTGVGPEGLYISRTSQGGYVDPDINPGNVAGEKGFAGLQALTFVTLVRRNNTNSSNLQCALRYRLNSNVNSNELSIGLSPYNQNNVIAFKGPTSSLGHTLGGALTRADTVFVAGVWDRANNEQRLYVNGRQVNQGAAGTNQIPTDSRLTLYHADSAGGTINTGFLPYGTYVYQRVLTDDEIRALYNGFWQIFSEVPSDEEEYLYSQITQPSVRLLYLNNGAFSQFAPRPDAKPLALINGVIRERIGVEGQLLKLDEKGHLRTVAQ